MAKAILICGKLCCGKSTYTKKLLEKQPAMVLSCDDLMLSLLPEQLGVLHEEVSRKAQEYLFARAAELLALGVTVILEWGFWQKESRRQAEEFFRGRGFETEWHYIRVTDEEWRRRIEKRNAEAPAGVYQVDENLVEKCRALFEEPDPEEVALYRLQRPVRRPCPPL